MPSVPARRDPDDKRQPRLFHREVVIRVKILEPLRGTLFAVGLDGLHDDLARHRNTPIIPASMDVSPRSPPNSLSPVGVAVTQRQPGNPRKGMPSSFLLSFLEAYSEPGPGVVAVFCARASAGPPAVSVALPLLCPLLRRLVPRSRCRRPLGLLARSADFASAQEKAPARQQEQRVSGDFPKKQKHRKSLWRPVAAVAGCFARASVWSPSQPAGQGLPLVPALASAGARAPCIEIPVDIGRTTAYQVFV